MDSCEKYLLKSKRSRFGQKKRMNCKADVRASTDTMVSFRAQMAFENCLIQSKGVGPLYLPVNLSLYEFCPSEGM